MTTQDQRIYSFIPSINEEEYALADVSVSLSLSERDDGQSSVATEAIKANWLWGVFN